MHFQVEKASLSLFSFTNCCLNKRRENDAHFLLFLSAWPSPEPQPSQAMSPPVFCCCPMQSPQVGGGSERWEEVQRRKRGAEERSTLFDKIVKSSLYCRERISK